LEIGGGKRRGESAGSLETQCCSRQQVIQFANGAEWGKGQIKGKLWGRKILKVDVWDATGMWYVHENCRASDDRNKGTEVRQRKTNRGAKERS